MYCYREGITFSESKDFLLTMSDGALSIPPISASDPLRPSGPTGTIGFGEQSPGLPLLQRKPKAFAFDLLAVGFPV
jgi:hypothetical protein